MNSNRVKRAIGLAVITLLICTIYLLWNSTVSGAGFPLDDSWIHQTFARNLAETGRWEYVNGELAAGSTSPLWTMLLAAGHRMKIDPTVWVFTLGIAGLILTVILCDALWRTFQSAQNKRILPLFGLVIAMEWHLVWSALSGMETILYVVTVCLIFYLLLKQTPPWLLIGGLTGLLVWIRPDGLTMLGPMLFLALWNSNPWRQKWKAVGFALVGTAISIALYMAFNYSLDGSIWPNTLYAKQIEYAVLREQSIVIRYFRLFGQINIGAGAILAPGFLWQLYRIAKDRNRWGMAAFLWMAGFIGIYAVQLPVTYQHGRYLIPVIPVYLLLGFSGFMDLISRMSDQNRIEFVVKKAWLISIVGVQAAFCLLGMRTYANDVSIINTEMVKAAQWVAENLPEDAKIATHDIGALGYFTRNPIVDLAGLINPEVIPIIRDEPELIQYLQTNKIDYLVAFPGWYPLIVKETEMIYNTNSLFSPQAGGENISVYLLK